MTDYSQHFIENLQDFSQKIQSLFLKILEKEFADIMPSESPDPLNIGPAFLKATDILSKNPQHLLTVQIGYWQDMLQLWDDMQKQYLHKLKENQSIKQAWHDHPVFDFLYQSHMVVVKWIMYLIDQLDLETEDASKVRFYAKQWLNIISPRQYIWSNPEILKATFDTNGQNLQEGLKNLYQDFNKDSDQFAMSVVDKTAFEVGKNLAVTPGKVIFQNHLMQLIQYTASTENTYENPILFVPPWINKYYILDLQQSNSFVKWVVDQGHTVFMISWVNPDSSLRYVKFEDYMQYGVLNALDVIQEQIGPYPVQAISYCIGGTLLSASLAYMKANKDERICSATFLTSLVDFSEIGDLSVFINQEQLDRLDQLMSKKGYLEPKLMMKAFQWLRSDDLIWSFIINNYLLGKKPKAFDFLYWSSDNTAMPEAMHHFYMHEMYVHNRLAKPNGLTLCNTKINLSKIDIDCFILSAKEDHISPWESTYSATQIYQGNIKFLLASSGHISAVINPPKANKYHYYTNDDLPETAQKWLKKATRKEGAWWPEWMEWQKQFSGNYIDTLRDPATGIYPPIEDAPGEYVKKNST